MRHIIAAFVLFGGLIAATPLNASQPIAVSVWPPVAVGRATAQLKVLVERNEANRSLTWEVDGPEYYRSSTIQLDGTASPRSWFFFVSGMPEGEFDVRATVKRNNDSQSVALTHLIVMAGAESR